MNNIQLLLLTITISIITPAPCTAAADTPKTKLEQQQNNDSLKASAVLKKALKITEKSEIYYEKHPEVAFLVKVGACCVAAQAPQFYIWCTGAKPVALAGKIFYWTAISGRIIAPYETAKIALPRLRLHTLYQKALQNKHVANLMNVDGKAKEEEKTEKK